VEKTTGRDVRRKKAGRPKKNQYYVPGFCGAVAYAWKGEYDLAIEDCTAAIWINPNFTMAYYDRGQLYYIEEQYDLAAIDLSKFVDLSDDPEMIEQVEEILKEISGEA